jgi:hypothetical protein
MCSFQIFLEFNRTPKECNLQTPTTAILLLKSSCANMLLLINPQVNVAMAFPLSSTPIWSQDSEFPGDDFHTGPSKYPIRDKARKSVIQSILLSNN